MAVITETAGTKRLTRKLRGADLPYWVAKSSGDAAGTYLLFRVGGFCQRGLGRTLEEAEQKLREMFCEQGLSW